ncbi:hypothetical protein N3K66_000069 [Trichothecium roseum]|uniref:Uncharacterized protein n=1 Tax=Trichothecium roseum TaxID=47278 RepID=A0ACC0VCH8_9HYPO|nr:hypothetical protein N3K66_000069 [Trichothecium roseum]
MCYPEKPTKAKMTMASRPPRNDHAYTTGTGEQFNQQLVEYSPEMREQDFQSPPQPAYHGNGYALPHHGYPAPGSAQVSSYPARRPEDVMNDLPFTHYTSGSHHSAFGSTDDSVGLHRSSHATQSASHHAYTVAPRAYAPAPEYHTNKARQTVDGVNHAFGLGHNANHNTNYNDRGGSR